MKKIQFNGIIQKTKVGDKMSKYDDGNATCLAFDKIFEFSDNEEVPALDYILSLDYVTVFKDACLKKIASLGHTIDSSDNECISDFILKCFNEKNIDVKAKTIKRWISKTEDTPENTYNERETVYKICFALSMNEKETEEFFVKGYLERAFNFKSVNESVYYFCLKNGLSYPEAQAIIAEISEKEPVRNPDAECMSVVIANSIASINNSTELVDYIVKNKEGFARQNNTAIETIKDLLPKCYRVATAEEQHFDKNKKAITNEDELLEVIYGYAARATQNGENIFKRSISDKTASKFPLLIKRNFPQREQLKNISKENASNDVIRKALIMLNFYYFFTEAQFGNADEKITDEKKQAFENGLFDEFVDEMNATLEMCGYVQLYWRNPFDWLIGYCAESSNPVDKLRDIIDELYLSKDEIYVKKEK